MGLTEANLKSEKACLNWNFFSMSLKSLFGVSFELTGVSHDLKNE